MIVKKTFFDNQVSHYNDDFFLIKMYINIYDYLNLKYRYEYNVIKYIINVIKYIIKYIIKQKIKLHIFF